MAAEGQRAPRVRERRGIAQRISAFWRFIEPGIQVQETFIESWDGTGEGSGRCIAFEGFGITATLFIGFTPKAVRS